MSDDYIRRVDAQETIKALPVTLDAEAVQRAIEAVTNCPAADVKPVVRGKWELCERRIISRVEIWKCSNCGNIFEVRRTTLNAGRGDCNFCPHCGADMQEEATP